MLGRKHRKADNHLQAAMPAARLSVSTAQATDRGWGWGWGCLEAKEKPAQQSERRARVEPGAGESGEDTVKAEEDHRQGRIPDCCLSFWEKV